MADETNAATWSAEPSLAHHAAVQSDAYRLGMRHFAAGVTIISARHGADRAGLTATAVCSLTADPPRLIVCVNKTVAANRIIRDSGGFCVNILGSDQEEIAKAFAGMIKGVGGEERFRFGAWDALLTGSPVLTGSLASFDCRVVGILSESTHDAFLGEVLATREKSDGAALVYLNGTFRSVAQ